MIEEESQSKADQLDVGQCGPAGEYVPTVRAAFVRRKEYGLSWPGAVYPGDEARERYVRRLRLEAEDMGIDLVLREQPLYNEGDTDRWLEEVEAEKPDGHLLILQDRHGPAWYAAEGAVDLGIPTVIFCTIGASFTTNTRNYVDRQGVVIYSAPQFDQAIFGMKMMAALARMKRTRCLVLHGEEAYDERLADTGIELRHLPERTYVEAFKNTDISPPIRELADQYEREAGTLTNASHEDVLKAARAYAACTRLIEDHESDAITMDCLGMGRRNPDVPLPCLAWSRFNDTGIPAICEADQGAIISHIITHYLFDRPGFQQDPVADTDNNSVIGAHCSCPTRLDGYEAPGRPFDLSHHHGLRDVTTETRWKKGQRVTSLDVYPGSPSKLEIGTGEVIDQLSVPPHGGCVISVNVQFDGVQKVRDFPGFHQVWFHGDYGDELEEFAQLSGFDSGRI